MIPRTEAVLSVLGELQEATESAGLDALTRVAAEAELLLAGFQLPASVCSEISSWLGVDAAAQRLYPGDAPAGLLPLLCRGEGNLLFDAASVLMVGSTRLSLELQVRTVVEMLLRKRYYLRGMSDSPVMLWAARFSLCAEESPHMLRLPAAVLEAIFDADVKASCFPGSFANVWHLYALASVLRRDIRSVYPMYNLKIRPYFNRLIRSRQGAEPGALHIMWSGELEAGSVFRPRTFVALIHAGELKMGSPGGEQRAWLCDSAPELSLARSSLYRWRRQGGEHQRRFVARYEAKRFFLASYRRGRLLPLGQFRQLFPDVPRSTYYGWKQELLSGGSTGETSPEDAAEPDDCSSPEAEPKSGERAHTLALMQEAKRSLQSCIMGNASFPYRLFKRSFPGISRSTYYNWRREAMLFTPYRELSASSEESDADKAHSPASPSPAPRTPRPKISARQQRSLRRAYDQKKRLRARARGRVQGAAMSFSSFKTRFPSVSSVFYWIWKDWKRRPEAPAAEEEEPSEAPQTHAVISSAPPRAPSNEEIFVMDVVALANFKAKAKLFLQQRFQQKSFPTFKEFRSYFPLTPRSTYYMWKRALHHGVPLIHG